MKQCAYILLLVLAASVATAGVQGAAKTMGKEIGTAAGTHSPAQTVLAGTDLFVEGFNDTSLTGFPPAGWIMINADGNVPTAPEDTAWYQSLTTGGTGTLPPYEGAAFAAAFYGSANGFYIDDYLVTPNTGETPPPGTSDSLTFWITSRLSSSGDYPDSLDIRVSTTGTAPADFTTRLGYVLAPKAAWTRFAYALPQSAVRYIAFRYLMYDGGATGSNSDKVCLDDVHITQWPSTGVGDGVNLPGQFALQQNYPNPFNPSTRIGFQLKNAGHATLTVYNVLGVEVATLVDGQLGAGPHSVEFRNDRLASGVYVYRLTSGGATETRRMILVR
jgi:hypothetical protein